MYGEKCFECQPGTYMTPSACPGAKVRATVHRDGYKKRPAYKDGRKQQIQRTGFCACLQEVLLIIILYFSIISYTYVCSFDFWRLSVYLGSCRFILSFDNLEPPRFHQPSLRFARLWFSKFSKHFFLKAENWQWRPFQIHFHVILQNWCHLWDWKK